jgi:hypothetical protein
VKRPSRKPSTRSASARGLEHEVVRRGAGRPGGRAGDVERKRIAGREGEPVADIGEHHQAFDLVIAVRPPPEHVQRQIDLGGSELDRVA